MKPKHHTVICFIKYLPALLMGCAVLTNSVSNAAPPTPTPKPDWRSGWLFFDDKTDTEKVIATAKALKFHALIYGAPGNRLAGITQRVLASGLEAYYWFGPSGSGNPQHVQVLSAPQQKYYDSFKSEDERFRAGFQGGGEPIPGHVDIMGSMPCFHYPEVVAATLKSLKGMIEANPQITGIALDGFGYRNLHDCHCPQSERLAKEYLEAHPELSAVKAREQFFFTTLVAFQNSIADEARRLRPNIKLTCHIWPAYLPRPLYGNNLNLDTTAETVTWFYKPYWADEKITKYTRQVVNDSGRVHASQQGVPFLGYFFGRADYENKSVERLEHELRVTFDATPSRSWSVFSFSDIVANPQAVAALQKVYAEKGLE